MISSQSNRFRTQVISPSHKPSQVNEIKHEKYEKEITQLKDEIKVRTWPLQALEAKMKQSKF